MMLSELFLKFRIPLYTYLNGLSLSRTALCRVFIEMENDLFDQTNCSCSEYCDLTRWCIISNCKRMVVATLYHCKYVKNKFIELLNCDVIIFNSCDYSPRVILVMMINQPINQLISVICFLGLEVIAIANM